MQSLLIPDVKDFMGKLFGSELFDAFAVSEASVSTFTSFQIDGSFHRDYYGDPAGAGEDCPAALTWKLLRPHLFELIKGKYVPLGLKLVFPPVGPQRGEAAGAGRHSPAGRGCGQACF